MARKREHFTATILPKVHLLGARVAPKGVEPTSAEYDEGEVVAVRLNGQVHVAWQGAGEEYREDPLDLVILK